MKRTLSQLQKQIQTLQKEAERLRAEEAAGVLSRIKEAIAVYHFTAQDLGVGPARAKSPKSASGTQALSRKAAKLAPKAIKFKDGQGNTWSGRGPRPGWFKSALESGRTPAQLLA